MSTSYVEYRGRGFWSFDPYLEDALTCLADAIDPERQTWLSTARDHWRTQASGTFAAWMHPQLDEFLESSDRQRTFLELTASVLERTDLTSDVRATLELMCTLICGELSTDASSPLDYMVQGPLPYHGVRT